MGLTEAATRKVGPLPAWGWGAVAVGGFVVWRFMRGGGDGTTDAGIPVDLSGTYDGGGGGGGGGGSTVTDTSAIQQALADAVQRIRDAAAAIPTPGSAAGGGTGGGTATGGGGGDGTGLPGTVPAVASLPSDLVSSFPSWGEKNPNGYGGDTYRLAQEYVYYITHPTAPRTDALFQKSDTELRQQLYGLLTGIAASPLLPGQQPTPGGDYFGNPYPEIPQWVLALGGVNRYTFGYVEEQYERQGAALNVRPEVTQGTTYADLAIAIPKLQSYIYNLQNVSNPTDAQRAKLAEYRARLADYQAQYKAMVYDPISAVSGGALGTGNDVANASGSPPAISYTAPVPSVGVPAPSTAAAPVDYSAAIATLNKYIANLQTGTVTQADRDKIATYQARIADYSSR